jgi:glycosyltransferase involved in cell wall biosynthesis
MQAPVSGRVPVSLVIPAYRAETYIANAIRSALNQACVPAEIIVVDDASPDATSDIAQRYGARVIRLAQNSGPSAARNAGVAAATQPWIAFLDADDVWLDGKLAAQWEAIVRWPDAGFCFTDYDAVYANGLVVPRETEADPGYALLEAAERAGDAVFFTPETFVHGLVKSMFVRQSSVVVNRDHYLACGGYDERLRLGEDYDFFLRLTARAPAISIERALVSYKRRSDSLSADPLEEIESIDALWTAVSERPERYPAGVVALIRRRRAATLRQGVHFAFRLGRFGEGAAFAKRACAFDRSPRGLALLAAARLLATPAGSATFRFIREAWRRRPGRFTHPAALHEFDASRF